MDAIINLAPGSLMIFIVPASDFDVVARTKQFRLHQSADEQVPGRARSLSTRDAAGHLGLTYFGINPN
jgi:hypothetical protein